MAHNQRQARTKRNTNRAVTWNISELLNWRAAGLAVLLLLMYGIGMAWGLPHEFSSAVDVPFPIGALAFFAQYDDPTSSAKYPALHYMVTMAAYAGVLLFLKLQGNLGAITSSWPYGFHDPVQAFSLMLLTSRMISLVMGIALLLLLARVMPAREDRQSRYLAISLVALSGPFTYYIREANFDIPYNLWWTLAFIFVARYLFTSEKPEREVLWAGLCSALAVGTKDQAAGLIIGLGAALFLIDPAHSPGGWEQRLKHGFRYGLVLIISYVLVAIAPHPARWWYHISIWTLNAPAVTDFIEFEPSLIGHLGLFVNAIRDLSTLLSPAGILLTILGFTVLIRSHNWKMALFLFLPIVTYYILIIANIRFVYERFMLPVSLLLIPAMGVGIWRISLCLKAFRRPVWVLAAAIGVGYQFFTGYLPITYVHIQDTKRGLAETLGNYVAPGSAILWTDEDLAHIPNANTYLHYRLMFPEGKRAPYRSDEHIFAPFSPDVHCFLVTRPSDVPNQQAKLIAEWVYPEWVLHNVMLQVPIQYYLYDLDGACQTTR